MPVRRFVATLAALTLVGTFSGCSSSDREGSGDATPTTTASRRASTTTAAPEPGADPAYEGDGPHQVGTTSFALADGRRVVSWYPAADSAAEQPKEIFDIASLLSPELQSQVPAEKRPQYEIDAHPGADQATDGPFPVVLFSHGFSGFPEQSADLVTHLASWGFVVVAPDHVERSLSGQLGLAAKGVPKLEDPEVLSQSLDAAILQAGRSESPLDGLLDVKHVAVIGHSAGAAAAYREASAEPRIKAFISYSVALSAGTAGPPAVPAVPGMVLAGTDDGVIPIGASRAVYDAMAAPKYFVEIEGAGHLVFSDVCLIGREQGGLVALVEEVGLTLPTNLLSLARDGCEADQLDPVKAFPAIDHLSVAFLRSTFGVDPEPVGLDPSVAKSFPNGQITLTADSG